MAELQTAVSYIFKSATNTIIFISKDSSISTLISLTFKILYKLVDHDVPIPNAYKDLSVTDVNLYISYVYQLLYCY